MIIIQYKTKKMISMKHQIVYFRYNEICKKNVSRTFFVLFQFNVSVIQLFSLVDVFSLVLVCNANFCLLKQFMTIEQQHTMVAFIQRDFLNFIKRFTISVTGQNQ